MGPWKKSVGAIKDGNSIIVSGLASKSPNHNLQVEVAVIKATCHDESSVDYKHVKLVLQCLRTTPNYTKPLIRAISIRMEKTRSWVVALKGLMLMHGVLCCDLPAVHKIGRLPFDLSDFSDRHSAVSKAVCVNGFVRTYFEFLDQKSVIAGREWARDKTKLNEAVAQQLMRLDELQTLLDKLLQLKPFIEELMQFKIIIEAMDCVLVEIFQIYSCICEGISIVLMRIYETEQKEATKAVKFLRRATAQGHELQEYFEFCRKHGIMSAEEFPMAVEIPQDDIKELERMIKGLTEKDDNSKLEVFDDDFKDSKHGGYVDQQCPKETENMFNQKQPVIAPAVLPDLITL